jgi:hypothetical protein
VTQLQLFFSGCHLSLRARASGANFRRVKALFIAFYPGLRAAGVMRHSRAMLRLYLAAPAQMTRNI